MDTISSAAFRRTYAKLDRLTAVTANGHVIGVWDPGIDARRVAEMELAGQTIQDEFKKFGPAVERIAAEIASSIPTPIGTEARWDTQPLRAVPKTRK